MNRKGFIDLDFESFNVVAFALAIITAFIALFVMKSSTLGIFWKVMTFICTTAGAYFVMNFIINKE